MAGSVRVEVTQNFERNLDGIERFLLEADADHAFDALLEEVAGTVIPNLARFPEMGRRFLSRQPASVETHNEQEALRRQIQRLEKTGELREYVLANHLALYWQTDEAVYLLAIKHDRQLSFDFGGRWTPPPDR